MIKGLLIGACGIVVTAYIVTTLACLKTRYEDALLD